MHKMVIEGKAKLSLSSGTFYNPKMKGLRDLSVLFLKQEGLRGKSVLDSTSASGIRAIRYALECGAKQPTLLDINKAAYQNMKLNLKKNRVKATALNESIQEFCNSGDRNFDIIDLDPFGSAAPYVYDLMKVSKDNSLLMITATDTAVLCGANPGACIKYYASQPLHNELCHEVGIRILANYVAKIASQFNYGIRIRLAVSNLHYMRLFLSLEHGAAQAVRSVKETGFGAYCGSCRAFSYAKGLSPKLDATCNSCTKLITLFGPLWLGSIYDKNAIGAMLKLADDKTDKDAIRILETIYGEIDIPLSYSIPKLTRHLGTGSVSKKKVIEKLRRSHNASETHFEADAIKTDAGIDEVYKTVKALMK